MLVGSSKLWTMFLNISIMMKKSIYKSLNEWGNSSISAKKAYKAACYRGIIPELCIVFGWESPKKIKPKGYWDNLENCKKGALTHKTVNELNKKNNSCYKAMRRNGWVEECCEHMVKRNSRGYYNNLENCKKESKKYKTRSELQKKSGTCYKVMRINGWLEECCKHMVIRQTKPSGYWNTLENCREEAKKYKTRNELWKKSNGCYAAMQRNGWLDECSKQMK